MRRSQAEGETYRIFSGATELMPVHRRTRKPLAMINVEDAMRVMKLASRRSNRIVTLTRGDGRTNVAHCGAATAKTLFDSHPVVEKEVDGATDLLTDTEDLPDGG